MAIDGKLLALAREELAQRREQNAAEHERRQTLVYERLPQIAVLDLRLQQTLARLISTSLHHGADSASLLAEIDEKSALLRRQKADLLRSAGYPEDYLDEIETCPVCHDSGYLRDGSTCQCLKELYARQQSKALSSLLKLGADDFRDFDLRYYSTAVDPAYGISPRDCMELVYETCRDYASGFGARSPNLLFRGGTGLGKTFLSACIAKAVAGQGFSVVYETAVAAFEAFENQKFGREEFAGEKVARILHCDLMILDDLGTEMTTQFSQSALYTIVNTRLTSGKKTIISTNLSAGELNAKYTPQIASRIEGEYRVLRFLGRDIRAIKKEELF